MAVRVPRILDLNLAKGANTVLSADSFETANPTRYLLDQLRSKTWRSSLGWTIVTGFNDKIDFEIATVGTFAATIAAGSYATAEDLCVALVTACEAAYAPPNWQWLYDSSTGLFSVDVGIGVGLKLLFGTGANLATSVQYDIGFDTADTITFNLHEGDTASYQSRHWLGLDLGSAQAATAAIVLGDNVSASGTVKLNSSATSILDALTAPDATQTLAAQTDYRSVYFASQSHRYLAFLVTDIGNSDGYAEIGIAYAGTYRQPTVAYASEPYGEQGDDLSTIERATEGAHHGDLRPEARAWSLMWHEIQDADAAIFRAFRTATPKGKCFFFDFDAGTAGSIVYGFRADALPLPQVSGIFWSPTFTFVEALP